MVRFRWRFATDTGTGAGGWYVDTIALADGYNCCTGSQVPLLQISSATLGTGTFTLTWRAQLGRSYRVQSKDDLGSGSWADIIPDVVATGTQGSATVPAGVGQRLYRLMLVP
jgi:hypothetical protein